MDQFQFNNNMYHTFKTLQCKNKNLYSDTETQAPKNKNTSDRNEMTNYHTK